MNNKHMVRAAWNTVSLAWNFLCWPSVILEEAALSFRYHSWTGFVMPDPSGLGLGLGIIRVQGVVKVPVITHNSGDSLVAVNPVKSFTQDPAGVLSPAPPCRDPALPLPSSPGLWRRERGRGQAGVSTALIILRHKLGRIATTWVAGCLQFRSASPGASHLGAPACCSRIRVSLSRRRHRSAGLGG